MTAFRRAYSASVGFARNFGLKIRLEMTSAAGDFSLKDLPANSPHMEETALGRVSRSPSLRTESKACRRHRETTAELLSNAS